MRFFKDTEKIPLEFSFAKSLMDNFSDFALQNKSYIPYELLCWRQLTYDIEPLDVSVEDFLKQNLTPFKLPPANLKQATGSEYTSKWFFNYSEKYPELIDLIGKICALKQENFEDFDNIVSDFVLNFKNLNLHKILKKRFLYQSFFFKSLGFKNLSSLFASIFLVDEVFIQFFEFSIKRSVYEFFLNLEYLKNSTDKRNIFLKEKKVKFFDFNSKLMLELIEKKWTN